MKITDVKAIYPKWRNRAQGAWQSHFWQIVVRIETDAGVTGYGYGGGGEPGVLIINGHLRELLIGKTVQPACFLVMALAQPFWGSMARDLDSKVFYVERMEPIRLYFVNLRAVLPSRPRKKLSMAGNIFSR